VSALSLRVVVAEALADIGMTTPSAVRGRPRETLWLPHERGVGIRIYVSGRRVYVAQAVMGGRARTVTIGPSHTLSEAQAIAVARRVLAHAMVGHDPATTRQRVRAAPDWHPFIDEYWRTCSPRWKTSTRAANDIYRRRWLDDAFDSSIEAIDIPQVTRWFARVTEHCGPGGANRCIGMLNAMMMKAEEWGYRIEGSNPCRSVRRNRARRIERYLSDPELARLGAALRAELAGDDLFRSAAASIIATLILTGCRRGEIVGLKWADVRGQRLQLPNAKAGPRTVWLSKEARGVIGRCQRAQKVPWVFTGSSRPLSRNYLERFWTDMRVAADLQGVRLHDLRHSFASHAVQGAETLVMIGKLLGHASIGSTARYAHLDDAGVQAANEGVGQRVAELLAAASLHC
jgi:integrase